MEIIDHNGGHMDKYQKQYRQHKYITEWLAIVKEYDTVKMRLFCAHG